MRLGAIAETLLERIALRANAVPEPLAETQLAFSMARSIMAGAELGVFEAVADGARSAAEIAARCDTHAAATEKLLNALTACRYFRVRRGSYELTPKARKWLLRRSPNTLYDKLLFQRAEWDLVAGYADYVRTGQARDIHSSRVGPELWSLYQRAMRNLASVSANEVASRFPMPDGATDLLDIGGAHGHYSVQLCRRFPRLRAVVLDLPDAVAHSAALLAEENPEGRVSHRVGDALRDDLGERSVDAVFVSQLVHHFTDEQNRALLERIARALRPNGVCVLLDGVRPAHPGQGGQSAALLDLYFALTSASGTWPLETMQAWLRDAGLAARKPIWLRTLPGGAMVVGVRN
jgi:SAM-dependent methyltransferase